MPRIDEIGLDGTVVCSRSAAALLTSLVFGLIPALQATDEHLLRGLQESGRGGGGGRTHRVRAALVVVEMALAVVLLTGAGLLIRSFVALTAGRSGIPAERRDGVARDACRALNTRAATGARARRSAARAAASAARRDRGRGRQRPAAQRARAA